MDGPGIARRLLFSLALCVCLLAGGCAADGIRFGRAFGSHMVLQQAPQRASVQGFASGAGQVISVVLASPTGVEGIFNATSGSDLSWHVLLNPVLTSNVAHTLTAHDHADGTTADLEDVLFGDVWVCSGQSNMAFLVEMAFNGSSEVADADNYPYIRLFTTSKVASNTSLADLPAPKLPWAVASSVSISQNAKGANDDNWLYFSATCWFFGRDIFRKLKYPIGLVNTNWGGTDIESWSSPDAISRCYGGAKKPPADSSVRWRGMVEPLLSQTVKGAVWYQGEANADSPYPSYNCTFPAMIDDWRAKWFKATSGATNLAFPFGFVQLSSQAEPTIDINFPALRWAQTANFGFVPNKLQPNVFMAVAYDLGDLQSPYTSIHPRYKQDVGERLSLAGLDIAYDIKTYWQGPLFAGAVLGQARVHVTFSGAGATGIELRQPGGWEICQSSSSISCYRNDITGWYAANATLLSSSEVMVGIPSQTPAPTHIRYAWRTYPCSYKACGVYAKSEGLPTPPFWGEVAHQ